MPSNTSGRESIHAPRCCCTFEDDLFCLRKKSLLLSSEGGIAIRNYRVIKINMVWGATIPMNCCSLLCDCGYRKLRTACTLSWRGVKEIKFWDTKEALVWVDNNSMHAHWDAQTWSVGAWGAPPEWHWHLYNMSKRSLDFGGSCPQISERFVLHFAGRMACTQIQAKWIGDGSFFFGCGGICHCQSTHSPCSDRTGTSPVYIQIPHAVSGN